MFSIGLLTNVSYVLATSSLNSNNITYSIESSYFTVNKSDGRIYLKAYLNSIQDSTFYSVLVKLTASDGINNVTTDNTISIVDVNNHAPTFTSTERVFEVLEVDLM